MIRPDTQAFVDRVLDPELRQLARAHAAAARALTIRCALARLALEQTCAPSARARRQPIGCSTHERRRA